MSNKLNLNVMFSFLCITQTFKYLKKFKPKILILILGMIGAEILNIDYGWYGIASSLLMLEFKVSQEWILGWSLVNILYTVYCGWLPQMFAMFAPLILIFYKPSHDRKPNAIEKRFFYYFYPIHIASLAALRAII